MKGRPLRTIALLAILALLAVPAVQADIGLDLAPLAQDQSFSTSMDTVQEITLVATDPNGDELTFMVIEEPQHGTLSGEASSFLYTPSHGYTGPDAFMWKASDGSLDSTVATVSISMLPPSDAQLEDALFTSAPSDGSASEEAAPPSADSLGRYIRTGAWIVRLSPGTARADIEQQVLASGGRMIFWLGELGMAVVSGVPAADARDWPGVESVVPDVAFPLPDLQSSGHQTPQSETGLVGSPIAQQQWNMRQIRADVAIDKGHTGNGAVVAVIDTGIFAEHPDLVGNVLVEEGRNFYAPYFSCAGTPLREPPDDPSTGDCPALDSLASLDPNPNSLAIPLTAGDPNNTTDDVGHGTFMAGLIAAHGGEHGTGLVGVAPEAKLLPVRVCSTGGFCPLGAIAAGVAYAVEHGVTIANMAVNGFFDVSTEEGALFFEITNDILDFAFENGLTIVVPAGNGFTHFDEDATFRPLNGWLDNVVTATGVGPTGRLSSNQTVDGNATFQRPLQLTNTGAFVDIAGPGGDFMFTRPNDSVISTTSPIGILGSPTLYSVAASSSCGTAHVSGVAAQIVAKFGSQNPKKLMDKLYEGTIDLGPRGRDTDIGHGLTDVPRTLGLD